MPQVVTPKLKMREALGPLRPPAYGKALLDNRRRGFHPLWVELYYGDDWKAAGERAMMEKRAFVRLGAAARPYDIAWQHAIGHPMLAIRPREYAPGIYDFRCVTGVQVLMIDGCEAALDVESVEAHRATRAFDLAFTRWGLFYDLLAELSQWAAYVQFEAPWGLTDAAMAAHDASALNKEQRRFEWPRWWSDALQKKHVQRLETWLAAARQRTEPATAGA
jgi:hypothetical protein